MCRALRITDLSRHCDMMCMEGVLMLRHMGRADIGCPGRNCIHESNIEQCSY